MKFFINTNTEMLERDYEVSEELAEIIAGELRDLCLDLENEGFECDTEYNFQFWNGGTGYKHNKIPDDVRDRIEQCIADTIAKYGDD